VPFWEGTREGELRVQHCNLCGHDQLYPRIVCTVCHRSDLSWRAASGRGSIYSVTVVRRAPSATYSADVPYAIALVELDEGPRLMSNIVGCDADDVRIGMRVVVDFDELAGDVRVPRFRPDGGAIVT
jgi:uncharacterized OB-fold protein